MPASGQTSDCKAGMLLPEHLQVCCIVLTDKGYDIRTIRRTIEAAGIAPGVPPDVGRRWKPC